MSDGKTHFKIISTGWRNWPWIQRTLESVASQEYDDYEYCIVDDASGDSRISGYIQAMCERHNWRFILQPEHRGGLFNQVAGIRLMEPAPEDVIVFLDSDGDYFPHVHVLDRLDKAYADGSKLVYTQNRHEPRSPTTVPSRAYPREVIEQGSYRRYALQGHGYAWNHLRSFKADLFLQMTDEDWQDDNGQWFQTCTDTAMMFPALELANGKVKFLDEVLYVYRPDHELSDWRRFGKEIDRNNGIILNRPRKIARGNLIP
jgi:glycosyltransferase involved in cell wall biosynthesis